MVVALHLLHIEVCKLIKRKLFYNVLYIPEFKRNIMSIGNL